MKVLVTGGSGFIGSHLVEALLNDNHQVTVVDNFSTGYRENLNNVIHDIQFVEGNCGDASLMTQHLQGVDIVYHKAALTSVPRSMDNPTETFQETMAASFTTLECARQAGVSRFIYAASSSTYGDREEEVKSEDLYPQPISPYAASKTALEMFASAYASGFGMTTVGLRYFNVFGPRQDPKSDYAAVIPIFIRKMLENTAPTITGDGDQSRDFTYVANVVEANMLAMKADVPEGGSVVNVATGHRTTLPGLIEALNKASGNHFEALYGESRPGDVRHSLASVDKAREVLGYEPVVDFQEGLQHTWNYAKENWRL